MSDETGKGRTVARLALGGVLVVAGVGHLTAQRAGVPGPGARLGPAR